MVLALATVAFAANWTGSAVEPENMKKIDGKAFFNKAGYYEASSI